MKEYFRQRDETVRRKKMGEIQSTLMSAQAVDANPEIAQRFEAEMSRKCTNLGDSCGGHGTIIPRVTC